VERVSIVLLEVVRLALEDLVARPLRTLLTLAGFVISMVIAVVLISSGAAVQVAVTAVLRGLGEGQIIAQPGRTTGVGGVRRSGRSVRIRYEDVRNLDEALPSYEGFAAFYDLRGGGATSRRYSIPWSPARAVAQDYQKVRRIPIREGRWFTREEEQDGQWVAVLNEELRKMIFRDEPAVGQWIEWRGRRMTVVGVIRDDALFPYIFFIPYETVSYMADARYISGLIARPAPEVNWDRAVAELRRVLGGLGGFDPADSNALEVETNIEFTRRVRVVTAALHALVVTIAAVSLLLGGLGVANMMVIAVTERTREIGLRRAVGATRRLIFFETFVAAMSVVGLGGLLGMGIGFFACKVIGNLELSTTQSATIVFDLRSACLSLSALAIAGVVAAVVPARRAAALPTAEALRWE